MHFVQIYAVQQTLSVSFYHMIQTENRHDIWCNQETTDEGFHVFYTEHV